MSPLPPGPEAPRPRIVKPVQERSKRTRQRIIDAAKALFADLGFEETTTNLIARHAGVSVGSVYAHFQDKWEIFLTILEDFSREVYDFLKAGVDAIIARGTGLEEVVEWLVRGLYRTHRLNGKLNLEIAKFVLKDARAAKLRAEWETRINREVLRLLTPFRDQIAVENLEAGVIVAHRSAHEVFQFLYRNGDRVDKQAILSEFVTMIKRYIVK